MDSYVQGQVEHGEVWKLKYRNDSMKTEKLPIGF